MQNRNICTKIFREVQEVADRVQQQFKQLVTKVIQRLA